MEKEAIIQLQPNYDNFVSLGKDNDFIFQALAHLGNASHLTSWANTVIEDVDRVPQELKIEMIQICEKIHVIQDQLRLIKR
jgi:hypothetical protein